MIKRVLCFSYGEGMTIVRIYFRDETHLNDWREDNPHLLHHLSPEEP